MADFMAERPGDTDAYLIGYEHGDIPAPGTAHGQADEGDPTEKRAPGEDRGLAGEGQSRGEPRRADGQRPTEKRGLGNERGIDGERHPGGSRTDGERGGRDERLAEFAQHRCGDSARPNAWHVMTLNDLTGPDDRCPGATDNEALGLMGRWKAVESWAAARMLGVVREMIRRRAVPEKGMVKGDLPWQWEPDLEHEVAAQLRVSLVAARKLLHVAWSLEARLPKVGKALDDGRLEPGQAKMIVTETDALPDDKAPLAEELILAGLDDFKTWADLMRLVQRAVCTADPDGAARRREEAERESARVTFWRESSGACALAGHALPTDQALAAWAHVEARAQHYRQQGIKEYIDLLRVMAYLDLLNGVPAEDRIAQWAAEAAAKAATDAPEAAAAAPGRAGSGPRGTDSPDTGAPGGSAPGDCSRRGGTPSTGNASTHGKGDSRADNADDCTPGSGSSSSDNHDEACAAPEGRPHAGSGPEARPGLPAKVNLTIPLGTAAGWHDRPGEAWELGALDPALARQLLAAAARSPGSEFCVTVVDQHGFAVGHGCCKPAKHGKRDGPAAGKAPPGPAPPYSHATFTRRDGPGPPKGFGSWTLTLPGAGTTYTVDLKPVPTHACDHAYESAGHDPSDWLRHVVQVRDGKCSFPSCGRHARESDFEHAVAYEEDGKTCACNCHACSRTCHQVKQRPGWSVTSPKPGWHQWQAPSGRSYVQGPWQYPT
jgi:hypothetical protein